MRYYKIQQILMWCILVVGAVAAFYWIHQQQTQTKVIRIATASKGGYYYEFGTLLKKHIEKHTNYDVELQVTNGSVDNRSRLLANEADLAILQTSAVSLRNLAVVTPLWDDYVHIVVRKGSGIESLKDIENRNFAIGVNGSGYRENGSKLLDHYGIDIDKVGKNNVYFARLLDDETLDGAIVTTGLRNPDLTRVMESGQFELISLGGAEGLSTHSPYYRTQHIPQGVYRTVFEPRPEKSVSTVTSDAVLAAGQGASYDMIKMIMPILYSIDLRIDAPILVTRDPTKDEIWKLIQVHPAARSYFDPYATIGTFASFFNTIARFKGVIILSILLLIAGVIQLKRGRKHKNYIVQARINREMQKILQRLSTIERASREVKDLRVLRDYLDEMLAAKKTVFDLLEDSNIETTPLVVLVVAQCNDTILRLENRLIGFQTSAPTSIGEHAA